MEWCNELLGARKIFDDERIGARVVSYFSCFYLVLFEREKMNLVLLKLVSFIWENQGNRVDFR